MELTREQKLACFREHFRCYVATQRILFQGAPSIRIYLAPNPAFKILKMDEAGATAVCMVHWINELMKEWRAANISVVSYAYNSDVVPGCAPIEYIDIIFRPPPPPPSPAFAPAPAPALVPDSISDSNSNDDSGLELDELELELEIDNNDNNWTKLSYMLNEIHVPKSEFKHWKVKCPECEGWMAHLTSTQPCRMNRYMQNLMSCETDLSTPLRIKLRNNVVYMYETNEEFRNFIQGHMI